MLSYDTIISHYRRIVNRYSCTRKIFFSYQTDAKHVSNKKGVIFMGWGVFWDPVCRKIGERECVAEKDLCLT